MATREYGWYTQLLDYGAYFGDFADDFDQIAIRSEYIDAINAALPDGFYLAGLELCGPADATEVPNVLAIAEGVDFDAIVRRHEIVNHGRNTGK